MFGVFLCSHLQIIFANNFLNTKSNISNSIKQTCTLSCIHKPTFLLSMTAQNKMQNNICVRHIAYHFICHTYVALINSQFHIFQFSTLWLNLLIALCRHMVLFKKYLLWKFTKVLLVTFERDISSCFLYTESYLLAVLSSI